MKKKLLGLGLLLTILVAAGFIFGLRLIPSASSPEVPVDQGEKIFCRDPRPEVCPLGCAVPPPYICGANGKSYCSRCAVCADSAVKWYTVQDAPCGD